MSFLFPICAHQKCFVRTVSYTDRYLTVGTKVALDNSFAMDVSTKRPVGAGYYACPTGDTLFHINGNLVTPELFMHRACETRVNAPRFSALATLDRKRNLYVPLHVHTRQWTRSLPSECFDEILGLRMLYTAVYFTQATANAHLFFNIYSLHPIYSSNELAHVGNRLPILAAS
jgi:hypothetical protein